MRVVSCEICGADFQCGRESGCWCTTIGVSTERRREIAPRASDCVCPGCLTGRRSRQE